MRRQRVLSVITLVGALLSVPSVQAQTSTPTSTPTQTPTHTPTHTPPRGGSGTVRGLDATLHVAATAPGLGTAVYAGRADQRSVQVTVGASCTSYTLKIEGSNDGLSWGQIGTNITQATYAAGATGLAAVATVTKYLRANISDINSCTLTVRAFGVPAS